MAKENRERRKLTTENNGISPEIIRRQEKKVPKEVQMYRELMKQSFDGMILLDPKGTIIEFNPAAAEINGIDKDNALGRKFWDVLSDVVPNKPSEQEKKRREEVILNATKTGQSPLFEKPIIVETIFSDGIRHFLEQRVFPIKTENGFYIGSVTRDITLQKQAEMALNESEEKFKSAFGKNPDAINLNSVDGKYLDINQGFQNIMGYTAEETLGRSSVELNIWNNPEDRTRMIIELKEKGFVVDFVAQFRKKSGEVITGSMSATFITVLGETCILSITKDTSIRQKMEKALGESEKKYRDLVEKIPDGIIEISNDGSFSYTSPAVEQLFGYSSSELLGMSFINFVHPDDIQEIEESFKKTISLDHKKELYEFRVINKAGEVRWVSLKSTISFDEKGKPFLTCVISDFTERKNAEAEIIEAKKQLEKANEEILVGLSAALSLKEKETQKHCESVVRLTIKLAEKYGKTHSEIDKTFLENLKRGALLHDIGKLGVPDNILLKPGELTDEEWIIMRQHPQSALDLLSNIGYLLSAIDVPYCHHEKWDGSGYPRGLKGIVIPLAARIFAIVDVWDALNSDRSYRQAWAKEDVVNYIRQRSGADFDPEIVDVFLKMIENEPDLNN